MLARRHQTVSQSEEKLIKNKEILKFWSNFLEEFWGDLTAYLGLVYYLPHHCLRGWFYYMGHANSFIILTMNHYCGY